MYLLDTNVVSELRTPRSRPADPRVLRWSKGVSSSSTYLSVVTVLEVELGMLQMTRRDPLQGAALRTWIYRHLLPGFDGRILPIDTEIAQLCASLHVPNPKPERDALIAATALVHRMTVVTRNTAGFTGTGVMVLNPWEL